MKPTFLVAGILLGVALAMVLWPAESEEGQAGPETPEVPARGRPWRTDGKVSTFDEEQTAREQYRNLEARASLRNPEIRDRLDVLAKENESGDSLGKEAKALLIHWARRDPQAALAWSWETYQSSRKWDEAVEEILETWVASYDPAFLDFLAKVKKRENALGVDEAGKTDDLFLHWEQMSKVRRWLYFYDDHFARMAHEQGVLPLAQFPRPLLFVDRMEDPAELKASNRYWAKAEKALLIQAALEERAESLGVELSEIPGSSGQQPGISGMVRMAAADPLTPSIRAAGTDLPTALAKAQELPVAERHPVYLMIYDSWKAAHPEELPDLERLPEEARMIWKDLSQLPPIDVNYSLNAYRR